MAINFPDTTGQPTNGSYTYNVAGLTYSWDGSSWNAAGAGATATDLTLLSVTTNSAGSPALSYDSNTGVFSYTPPDISNFISSESDTLATVTGRGATTSTAITLSAAGEALVLDGNNSRITLDGGNASGEIQVQNQGNSRITLNGTNGITTTDGIGLKLGNYTTNGWRAQINGSSGNIITEGSLTAGSMVVGGLTYPTTNGTIGQALIGDGAGNIGWGDVATVGLKSRTTASVTQSIANNAASNVSISTAKGFVLYSIETSHAAWVTLYADTASRTADSGRLETTDPTPGSGVLSEVITTGPVTQLITPGTVCFNSSPTATTYAKVVNKSGSTANVTVTLTYLRIEN